jgi:hypothetical protein
MKHCKEEFDRLMETSPSIAEDIIKEFMKTFSTSVEDSIGIEMTKKHNDFMNLKKPEICDALESTRMSVFNPQKNTAEKKSSITGHDLKVAIKNMDLKHKQKKINNVIVKFNKEKHRDPLVEEIMSELDNKIELEIVQSFLLYNAKKEKKNHISIDITIVCSIYTLVFPVRVTRTYSQIFKIYRAREHFFQLLKDKLSRLTCLHNHSYNIQYSI